MPKDSLRTKKEKEQIDAQKMKKRKAKITKWMDKMIWGSSDNMTAGWQCQCGFQFHTMANTKDFERHYEECEEA